MNKKSSFAGILMTAGMLLVFTIILGAGCAATAAQPADFAVQQYTASLEQPSPPVRLAQFTNPPAGTMLEGTGIFAPPTMLRPPAGSGGMFFVPDQEYGAPVVPRRVYNPYRRCPYGGFDCNL